MGSSTSLRLAPLTSTAGLSNSLGFLTCNHPERCSLRNFINMMPKCCTTPTPPDWHALILPSCSPCLCNVCHPLLHETFRMSKQAPPHIAGKHTSRQQVVDARWSDMAIRQLVTPRPYDGRGSVLTAMATCKHWDYLFGGRMSTTCTVQRRLQRQRIDNRSHVGMRIVAA